MSAERNKAVVRKLFELWNAGDTSRVGEFYDPAYLADYLPYSSRAGLDGIRAMIEGAHATFPDYHEELLEMTAEGDRVAVWLRITGTHSGAPWGPVPASGKRVSYEEMLLLTFLDGKVLHQRGIADNLSLLRPFELVPVPRGQAAGRPSGG